MFTIESDKTINVTRGDVVFLGLSAHDKVTQEKYIFQAGDIVRFSVYEKKDCTNVVLERDFIVSTPSEEVEIFLDEEDTKIGEPINKPTPYWYEVVLNPGVRTQTIVGYDKNGAKVFKLFPEGVKIPEEDEKLNPEDIPVVDGELDALSDRPVSNSAVSRAFLAMNEIIHNLENEIAILKGSDAEEEGEA